MTGEGIVWLCHFTNTSLVEIEEMNLNDICFYYEQAQKAHKRMYPDG